MKKLVIRLKPKHLKFSLIYDIIVCYKYKKVYGSSLAKLGYINKRGYNILKNKYYILYNLNLKLLSFWINKGAKINFNLLKLLKII